MGQTGNPPCRTALAGSFDPGMMDSSLSDFAVGITGCAADLPVGMKDSRSRGGAAHSHIADGIAVQVTGNAAGVYVMRLVCRCCGGYMNGGSKGFSRNSRFAPRHHSEITAGI
ncbi:hypothetical protein D3C75_1120560 [compost metagenome]